MIVVGPPAERAEASDDDLDTALRAALASQTPSRAAEDVAEALEIPRKRAYARALHAREFRLNRREAERRGRRAETIAAWWLRLHGWRILAPAREARAARSTSSPGAGKMLAFVEVKQRATADAAGMSLDRYRLRRVAAAAEQLAPRYARAGDDIRIDAIFIVPGRLPRHLVNVWQG